MTDGQNKIVSIDCLLISIFVEIDGLFYMAFIGNYIDKTTLEKDFSAKGNNLFAKTLNDMLKAVTPNMGSGIHHYRLASPMLNKFIKDKLSSRIINACIKFA